MKKLGNNMQKFKIESPESPRMAEIELRHGKWQVFCGWKRGVSIPSMKMPHFTVADSKEAATDIGKRWVNAEEWRK